MSEDSSNADANGDTAAPAGLRQVLDAVAAGQVSVEEAYSRLSLTATEDLGFATVDHAREARNGFPEVVYGAGKTPAQVAEIAASVYRRSGVVLVTRTGREAFEAVAEQVPGVQYDEHSRLIWADRRGKQATVEGVLVVAAGTSDLPVAGEAAMTASLMGCRVEQITDVGVAGLHRLLARQDDLRRARVLVVVAGMEGALPSVVAGLVDAPVIAVPTSVGYGASFDGLAALLTMMNSCAAGVSVVNIDGGFAAGFQAALIACAIAGGGRSD